MSRYIDVDEFVKRVIQYPWQSTKTIGLALADTPPADVVERKKGKWKDGCCTECGYKWGNDAPIASVPNYCPKCGADMRKEGNAKC